jgi:hypothetical protein
MYIDRIHAGQVARAHALVLATHQAPGSDTPVGPRTPHHASSTPRRRLLQRLAQWLKRPHEANPEIPESPDPTIGPECVGRPYVVGPGTFLVMAHLRKRLPGP